MIYSLFERSIVCLFVGINLLMWSHQKEFWSFSWYFLRFSGDVFGVKQNGPPTSNYQPVMSHPLLNDERPVQTNTVERLMSDPLRLASVTEVLGEMRDADAGPEDFQQSPKVDPYIFGPIQHQPPPTRPSKPRTSPVHDARAVSVARQSSFSCKDEQLSSKKVSLQEGSTPSQSSENPPLQAYQNLDQEHNLRIEYSEDAQSPYHHKLHQRVQHQLGIYHKSKPSASLDYPSWRILQTHRNLNAGDPDSSQHFHNYPSTTALAKSYQPSSPEEQLVSAEYIPAHPCRSSARAYAHHISTPHRGSEVSKANQNTVSQERGHQEPAASQVQPCRSSGGPKKCGPNEDRSGATKKVVKKVSRSQLQNGPQRCPERKYNTVERDGGGSGSSGRGSRNTQSRSKKQQQGNSRRWQSTLELSQDEADQLSAPASKQSSLPSNQRDHFLRRARKCRPTHPTYAYHHSSHLHQHMGVHLERCQVDEDYPPPGLGESESTLSEADSPDSSSLSSDSDESGGLIWPHPVSPQRSFPRPPGSPRPPLQSKAFVKIKASHALKKKILRFRTGSLKVMTTV